MKQDEILAIPEGVPLTAQTVAERRQMGASGMAPDVGLDPASLVSVRENAGGAQFLAVPPAKFPTSECRVVYDTTRNIPTWQHVRNPHLEQTDAIALAPCHHRNVHDDHRRE